MDEPVPQLAASTAGASQHVCRSAFAEDEARLITGPSLPADPRQLPLALRRGTPPPEPDAFADGSCLGLGAAFASAGSA
eukprot:4626500-Alexandrium_andersonii.AAC.1